jgi:hypothetical protein
MPVHEISEEPGTLVATLSGPVSSLRAVLWPGRWSLKLAVRIFHLCVVAADRGLFAGFNFTQVLALFPGPFAIRGIKTTRRAILDRTLGSALRTHASLQSFGAWPKAIPVWQRPKRPNVKSGAERLFGLCRYGACQGYFALQ